MWYASKKIILVVFTYTKHSIQVLSSDNLKLNEIQFYKLVANYLADRKYVIFSGGLKIYLFSVPKSKHW